MALLPFEFPDWRIPALRIAQESHRFPRAVHIPGYHHLFDLTDSLFYRHAIRTDNRALLAPAADYPAVHLRKDSWAT